MKTEMISSGTDQGYHYIRLIAENALERNYLGLIISLGLRTVGYGDNTITMTIGDKKESEEISSDEIRERADKLYEEVLELGKKTKENQRRWQEFLDGPHQEFLETKRKFDLSRMKDKQ